MPGQQESGAIYAPLASTVIYGGNLSRTDLLLQNRADLSTLSADLSPLFFRILPRHPLTAVVVWSIMPSKSLLGPFGPRKMSWMKTRRMSMSLNLSRRPRGSRAAALRVRLIARGLAVIVNHNHPQACSPGASPPHG